MIQHVVDEKIWRHFFRLIELEYFVFVMLQLLVLHARSGDAFFRLQKLKKRISHCKTLPTYIESIGGNQRQLVVVDRHTKRKHRRGARHTKANPRVVAHCIDDANTCQNKQLGWVDIMLACNFNSRSWLYSQIAQLPVVLQ